VQSIRNPVLSRTRAVPIASYPLAPTRLSLGRRHPPRIHFLAQFWSNGSICYNKFPLIPGADQGYSLHLNRWWLISIETRTVMVMNLCVEVTCFPRSRCATTFRLTVRTLPSRGGSVFGGQTCSQLLDLLHRAPAHLIDAGAANAAFHRANTDVDPTMITAFRCCVTERHQNGRIRGYFRWILQPADIGPIRMLGS
jgi:hypothetical protein